MKLRNYIALMKNEACCNIVTVGNEVWLGLHGALYRAPSMPPIRGNEQVRAVMDLTEKQVNKIFISNYSKTDTSDLLGYDCSDGITADEQTAETMQAVASFGTRAFSVLRANDGELIFYDPVYIAPLADILKDHGESVGFFVRKAENGKRYIVIKDGMLTAAVIDPFPLNLKNYLERLAEFETLCTEQYDREQVREHWKSAED